MRRPPLLLALLLAMSGSVSGCSWLFVQPLPARYYYVDCTTSVAAPVLDTILAIAILGSTAYVTGQYKVANTGTVVTAGTIAGAMWFTSAIYGYRKTSACRGAKEDVEPVPRYLLLRPPPPPVGYPQAAPAAEPPPPPPPPGMAPPPGAGPGAVPQQQDDDDSIPGARRAPPPPPGKLDAPRFGG